MYLVTYGSHRKNISTNTRWIPSELNFLDEGSRFFDCDYASSKSLNHVLAQRFTRPSPARTCDQHCFSPTLMHLDADCISGLMSHGSCAPLALCRPPEDWFDRNARMNRRRDGRYLIRVQKPVTHELPRRSLKKAQTTRPLPPPPDAKRPSRVLVRDLCSGASQPKLVSCLRSEAVSENLEELAREVARVPGQACGKEEDSETSDDNGPTTYAEVHTVGVWTTIHRLRMLVDHLMCRDRRSWNEEL